MYAILENSSKYLKKKFWIYYVTQKYILITSSIASSLSIANRKAMGVKSMRFSRLCAEKMESILKMAECETADTL